MASFERILKRRKLRLDMKKLRTYGVGVAAEIAFTFALMLVGWLISLFR